MLATRPQLVEVPVAPIADPAAERLLVAGCLTDMQLAVEVLLPLPPGAITESDLALVAGGIRALAGQSVPVDALSVWRELRRRGHDRLRRRQDGARRWHLQRCGRRCTARCSGLREWHRLRGTRRQPL